MICSLLFLCFSTFGGFTDGMIDSSRFLVIEHDRVLISSSSFSSPCESQLMGGVEDGEGKSCTSVIKDGRTGGIRPLNM